MRDGECATANARRANARRRMRDGECATANARRRMRDGECATANARRRMRDGECATAKAEDCTHDENERALLGTWTSVEVAKAVEVGYKIVEIYEIYHYPCKERIFSGYVNQFLKIKQQASGVPKKCVLESGERDEEAVSEYLKEYLAHEGVELDKDALEKKHGLRTIAKTLLNSLWGKLAQHENNTHVEFVDDYEHLLRLANDGALKLTSLDFVSETVLRCTYEKIDDAVVPLKTGNVIIASFVTAYLCLKLHALIKELGRKVLYFDTDSVLFVSTGMDEQRRGGGLYGGFDRRVRGGRVDRAFLFYQSKMLFVRH